MAVALTQGLRDQVGDLRGYAQRPQNDTLKSGAGQGGRDVFAHMVAVGSKERQAQGTGAKVLGCLGQQGCFFDKAKADVGEMRDLAQNGGKVAGSTGGVRAVLATMGGNQQAGFAHLPVQII